MRVYSVTCMPRGFLDDVDLDDPWDGEEAYDDEEARDNVDLIVRAEARRRRHDVRQRSE